MALYVTKDCSGRSRAFLSAQLLALARTNAASGEITVVSHDGPA